MLRHIEMVATGVTPEEFQQAIIENAPMTESSEMTIAEILHQRGFEKGEQVGQAAMLSRQLGKKFGRVPEWVEGRLRNATPAELELWAERVLVADSLDAVLGA